MARQTRALVLAPDVGLHLGPKHLFLFVEEIVQEIVDVAPHGLVHLAGTDAIFLPVAIEHLADFMLGVELVLLRAGAAGRTDRARSRCAASSRAAEVGWSFGRD